jgi:hypothetical protein
VSDIFEEVDEELRAERAQKLLKRYGVYLVLAMLLVLLAVAGWQAWKWYEAKVNARIAKEFLTALEGAASPAGDARKAALLQLAAVANDSNAGYRTLGRLREAALKADTGDAAGAEALWTQVASDGSANPLLRDVAVLQSVLHRIDHGDPAVLEAELKPLAAPDNPWQALAREAEALIALRQGQTEAARGILKQLTQDVTAPDGVRAQATDLLAQLNG